MPTRSLRVVVVFGILSAATGPLASLSRGEEQVDFAAEVLPVLSNKCYACHGPAAEADQLRLDSYAGATADLGGYRAIDPAEPAHSELLKRISDRENPMPPADAEKQLTESERQLLQRWVQQGGKYASHWAFVPPRKAPVPQVPEATVNELDAFIAARLQARGAKFAPEAERATLARRAALVLTGLPPEPATLQPFLTDQRADAYERLVDALLDDPRFGEHQARYWLDAVRYGDTHGLHLDNRRGIYPYRDWVVYALNHNLPWDQFLTWQLAGDLLPGAGLQQQVATGFVRMNPTTAEGGAIPEEFQAKNNFDRTETLGTVLLGMSLTCARCHTHKYDPIPQREYYQLLAFFNSTAEHSMDGNKYEYGPVAAAPANQAGWLAWGQLESAAARLLEDAAPRIDSLPESAQQALRQGDLTQRLTRVAAADSPFDAPARKRAAELLEQAEALAKSFTSTLVARDLPQPRPTRLLRRGEYHLPTGDPLEPGILTVMGPFPDDAPRNRLGLAKWLTAREHPLVARVLVNRMWQRVFGAGLVRTPEDFGAQGQLPTHPKLLDWLAVEFHDSGWDHKQMLRQMVTSRTFRQSSARREDLPDPQNLLWGRGPSYRLDAEVLRDLGLWASGLLDPTMGGEGVKPYQPPGMWQALAHPASNTKQYVADSGAKLYRRSLYVYWKRTSPHPMMTLFDAPSRESSCVRRSRTNTSAQSLGLLNETQRLEMSRMLAQRLLRQADDDTARLELLFTLLASRPPSQLQDRVCRKLLAQARERFQAAPADAAALLGVGEAQVDPQLPPGELAAWAQVCLTVLASDVAILLY